LPPGQDEAVEGKGERKLWGELIAGNVAGRTIEEIQREMEAFAGRNPGSAYCASPSLRSHAHGALIKGSLSSHITSRSQGGQ
jgi:hypothetical protein